MNLLLIVFIAYTVSYAAMWHNKSAGANRQDSSLRDKPPGDAGSTNAKESVTHR